MCPSVALDVQHTGIGCVFETFAGRGIVLMQSIQVGKILDPGGHNSFRLPVHVSCVDLGARDGMMLLQRLHEVLANSLLTRLEVAPIREEPLVCRSPVIKLENDAMSIIHIGHDYITQAPNQRTKEEVPPKEGVTQH